MSLTKFIPQKGAAAAHSQLSGPLSRGPHLYHSLKYNNKSQARHKLIAKASYASETTKPVTHMNPGAYHMDVAE